MVIPLLDPVIKLRKAYNGHVGSICRFERSRNFGVWPTRTKKQRGRISASAVELFVEMSRSIIRIGGIFAVPFYVNVGLDQLGVNHHNGEEFYSLF